jgi:DNA repair protein RecN (Recombination protein N)
MLVELSVRGLGVIDDVRVVLGPGLTAVTGETGAGKTLLVEAIELLVGARAEATLVRPGADEAVVEGRFIVGDEDDEREVVVSRVVPAAGRSRAYIDGRMAPVSTLAELGASLIDLHGQHAHQSLLLAAVQRAALDRFAALEPTLEELHAARAAVKQIDADLGALGGDAHARAREIDLLRYQLAEIGDAGLGDPDEDGALEAEEDRLADAAAHREAASAAREMIAGDGGALDAVGGASAALAHRGPFRAATDRLRAVAAELADVASELRAEAEGLADDPARLESVRARRQLLRELRRKYGGTLAEVMEFGVATQSRLRDLESYEVRAAGLETARQEAMEQVSRVAAQLGAARRRAAPELGRAIETHLQQLALPRARFEVRVGDEDPGDDVVFGLGANPGEPVLPLSKVASGGELARTMLAARLVLSEAPPTLVFDEVDAGIGGEAALAVGRALAALATDRQVLVVTHLPQVAAFADAQVAVTKVERRGRTLAQARAVESDDRLVELSRMLSGQPDSVAARRHAADLLSSAEAERRPRRRARNS